MQVFRTTLSVKMSATDRDALLALYRATQGARWTSNTGWDTNAELGRWHGVTVDEQGRVAQIDLNENNLQGTPTFPLK